LTEIICAVKVAVKAIFEAD